MLQSQSDKSKKCNICQKDKLLTDFHKRSDSKDGYNHQCKECANIRRRNAYYSSKVVKNPTELQLMITKQIENYVTSVKKQLPKNQQREFLRKALNTLLMEIDKI